MFTESQYLPISALQHLLFCPRQCGLILLENQWRDNRLTILGSILHKKVHQPGSRSLRKRNRVTSMPVFSRRLGLFGILDSVNISPGSCDETLWTPREFKHGKPKKNACDRVQLCAQAICLEEMSRDPESAHHFQTPISIPTGQIFYGKTRRCVNVDFTPELRRLTETSAAQLHALYDSRITPPADFGPKCRNCSLKSVCLPELKDRFASVKDYLADAFRKAFETDPS
jgi:CRISPR-associated exonuclease Cas4